MKINSGVFLMRRNIIGKKSIKFRNITETVWENTFLSMIVSILCGILSIILLCIVFSAVILYFLKDMKYMNAFCYFIFSTGIYSGTYICGKYRRKKGLAEGALSGIIIFLTVLFSGFLITGNIPEIKKLFILLICGAVGGIKGVNSKRPRKLTK